MPRSDAELAATEEVAIAAATGHGADAVAEGLIERICHVLCGLGLLAMILVVVTEVVTRNLFGFSFQVSDELGGYIVVLIAFLSLCVCQANDAYHHVEFLQARLSRSAQLLTRLIFDLLSLAVCVLITWQLAQLERATWISGDVAPTMLMTPLWLPQLAMVIGFAALSVTVLRTTCSHLRQLTRLARGEARF